MQCMRRKNEAIYALTPAFFVPGITTVSEHDSDRA